MIEYDRTMDEEFPKTEEELIEKIYARFNQKKNGLTATQLIKLVLTEKAKLVGRSHPEDYCQKCERPNIVWFAPSELWNEVVGDSNGILCPVCFGKLLEKKYPNAVLKIEIEK